MSTLKLRKLQLGKDTALNKNTVIGPSETNGYQAISIGTLETSISEPIRWSESDVIMLNPKAQSSPVVGDNSKSLATTEWANLRFGSNDVFADFTTNGNVVLSGLDLQANGDWNRVLTTTDVVFVKDKLDPAKNGWYNPREGAWVRIPTKDTSGEFNNSIITRVSSGRSMADTLWLLYTNITSSFILDTSPLVFGNINDSKAPGRLIDIKDVLGSINSIMFLTNDGYIYEAHGSSGHINYTSGKGQPGGYNVYGIDKASLIPIRSSSPVVDIHIGNNAAYALLENGELWVWGINTYGELGLGHTNFTPRPELSTTNVSKIIKNKAKGTITNGFNWILIQKSDGFVYACGYNGYSQFGLNDTITRTTWTRLDHIGQNPVGVFPFGGTGSLIYQKQDLSIWACGFNGNGQLGTGDTTQKNTPVDISNNWKLNNNMVIKKLTGGNGQYITTGDTNTYIAMLLDDGVTTDIRCCGVNTWNNLGDGTTTQRTTPVRPNIGTGRIKEIAAGPDGVGSMYVLKENGDLFTWGYNGFGQLGLGTTTLTPVPTLSTSNVLRLVQELHHYSYGHYNTAFIIKADGLYATGYGANGHGGWGIDSANRSVWTRVNLPLSVTADKIKVIGRYETTNNGKVTCLVTVDNVVWSWGYNVNYGLFYNNPGTEGVNSPINTNILRGH